MSRVITDFEQHLLSIIQPLHAAKWQADYRWFDLERSLARLAIDYGGLDLCPDFQRGHVWSAEQQRHFIENCLRAVVPTSAFLIQFNCSEWGDPDPESDLPVGLQWMACSATPLLPSSSKAMSNRSDSLQTS
ncbi:hypothetical protein [Stutzerimonas decontaminans]|uniref:hypothetical protein n=1 Tax=Stutzerimonas decontaminans TaxID=3022791 RepID=UPI000A53AAE2|nr:hypothetical protein [Stutzerimonas decontaminans]